MNKLQERRELTIDDIRVKAPSVFAERPYHEMSERYEFIKTSDAVQQLMVNGFIPVMATECKVRKLSKVGFSKHIIKFRHSSLLANTGDVPELVLSNSHDGTSAYLLQAGIFRIVCSNGLIVASESFQKVTIKHIGNKVDKVIEGSFKVIENLPVVMQQIEQWKGLQVSEERQLEYANEAIKLAASTLEFNPFDFLAERREEDQENNLYTVFNRVQENLLAGGMIGKGKNGKGRKSRAITSFVADNKLNQDLWQLTENTAKLLVA